MMEVQKEKMKTKILILVIGIITITFAAGITYALAHRGFTPYYEPTYFSEVDSEDWWTEMEEHMRYRWGDAIDEQWYDEMRAYMEEHFEELSSEEWYDEMKQYMEERWQSRDYGYGGYQRGFGRGCWGW